MPIRNPFSSKRPDVPPSGTTAAQNNNGSDRFEKVDTVGSSRTSSSAPRSIPEPAEYKMSVVNDSGVYLPPSPPEKKSFWLKRAPASSQSTATQSSVAEIEPFSISRESFDSYRRSFDISARSPVSHGEPNTRARLSLDANLPRLPRSAIGERRFETQPPTAEEGFEDVGLNDENKPPARKRGFFSRLGDSEQTPPQSPTTSTSRFHLPGRKRGHSGQGAELGEMPKPTNTATVAPSQNGPTA